MIPYLLWRASFSNIHHVVVFILINVWKQIIIQPKHWCICIYIYMHIYICIYIHIYTLVCLYIYTPVYMYVGIHIYVRVYIYIERERESSLRTAIAYFVFLFEAKTNYHPRSKGLHSFGSAALTSVSLEVFSQERARKFGATMDDMDFEWRDNKYQDTYRIL